MTVRHIAVIDIGKSNAKLALVDAADLSEIAVITTPNTVLPGPPYPHVDVDGIWAFLTEALASVQAEHGIDAIVCTTHGACGALIASDGTLAAPILDYECDGPDLVADAYDAIRPAFEETGSPRLPRGLNLGAQIHWQFAQDPTLRDRIAAVVTYPQFWGHRLTGAVASDVSSLGCHTDLWDPYKGRFSSLVDRLGLRGRMAPARESGAVLGPVRPELAARTGLRPGTRVHCGIHDSNASLLPHVMRRDPPFSVVSTGTWVIAMTIGGAPVALDPARDTLVNVNAMGAPVPSARFMGGREFQTILQRRGSECDADTLARVADHGPLLLPAVVPESGPFQGRAHRWHGPEPAPGSPDRAAALHFYLAMMTAECLGLTGHRGPVVVEGPFAANAGFCGMLSAAIRAPVIAAAGMTGTAQGAALLALEPEAAPRGVDPEPIRTDQDAAYARFAERWRRLVAA